MQITYLGHACYLVEAEENRILVDPLLTASFQDDTVQVYPPRNISAHLTSRITAIIITHCHPGHLEIPSLSLLPRDIPVFFPDDPTIELVLNSLKFINQVTVTPTQEIAFSDISIIFTGSKSGYAEVGCLFVEGKSSFWYLADTSVDNGIIQLAGKVTDKINLLACNYPAYNHKFFTYFDINFPYLELENSLNTVINVNPDLVIPNFNGLSYTGDGEWINHIMFPMSSEQFLREVTTLKPDQKTENLLPGDMITIEAQKITIQRGASPFVKLLCNNIKINFDPTFEIPKIKDPNPDNRDRRELKNLIKEFLYGDFHDWLNSAAKEKGSLIYTYTKLKVYFRLILVYSDYSEDSWLFKFNTSHSQIEEEVSREEYAHISLRIAASILHLWKLGEVPYFKAYCYSRCYGNIYSLGILTDEQVKVVGRELRDPISHYFNKDVSTVYHLWIKKAVKNLGEVSHEG